jgi:hypothetical protein
MPKYNDSFTLDMHDVELIEQALRVMWSEDKKKFQQVKVPLAKHQNVLETSTIY